MSMDWQTCYAAYSGKLLLFARQFTASRADAEDVLQEAFVRYWKLHSADATLTPELMFTLVRRIAIDRARSLGRLKARELCAEDWHHPAPEPWFEADAEETCSRVQQSLSSLSEEQRQVVILKIWGGLTFEQIGRTLEISPHTAASRYRYALDRLGRMLSAVRCEWNGEAAPAWPERP